MLSVGKSGLNRLSNLGASLWGWLRAHRKGVAAFLGAWLLAWLTLWAAVPGWLQPRLEKTLSEQLGRVVKVDKLDFRPWSLELQVHGLDVATADGKPGQFHVDRLEINAELQSLLRMAPVIDELVIERPRLKFARTAAGSYDIDDLIRKFSAPSARADEPTRFALYNLQLRGGEIDFDDQPVQKRHEVRALDLAVPFLSNLDSKRDIKVLPHLSLKLNGEALDTQAQMLPFAADRKMQVQLVWPHVSVVPYLAYLPSELPVRPTQGEVALNLRVNFDPAELGTASGQDKMSVAGELSLRQWAWTAQAMPPAAKGAKDVPAWLNWADVVLSFKDLNPLQRKVALKQVRVSGLDARLFQDRQGQWLGIRPAQSTPAKATPPQDVWQVSIDDLQVTQSRVAGLKTGLGGADLAIEGLNLQGQQLQWPMAAGAGTVGQVKGRFLWPELQAVAKSTANGQGTVEFTVSADPKAPKINVRIDQARLDGLKNLLPVQASAKLSGMLTATLDADLLAPAEGKGWQAKVHAPELQLAGLEFSGPWLRPSSRGGDMEGPNAKALPTTLRKMLVRDAKLEWPANRITVAQVQLDAPQLEVSRDAQGRWVWERWLQTAASAPSVTTTTTASVAPWTLSLQELGITGGHGVWWDAAATGVLPADQRPVAAQEGGANSDRATARLELKDFQLSLKSLQLSERGLGETPASYELKSQVSSMSRNSPKQGQLNLKGTVQAKAHKGTAPAMQLQASIQTQRLPLHTIDPYMREHVLVNLLRAEASVRARVNVRDLDDWQIQAEGAVDDMLAHSLDPSQELLSWKSLKVASVRAVQKPGQATMVEVGKTRLSDFYARLIISDKGQINLQQLGRKSAAAAATATQVVSAASPQAALAPVIRFEGIDMVNGRVNFSDFFIRPNYTANLSELNGSLGGFATAVERDQVQMADLVLRGKAQGTADLLIKGQLNPLAKPLALNIRGQVSDLELPPLSPYTTKYLGYAIERGKLNVDVSYDIDPKGTLTGKNNFVLQQLTLGEKIDGQGTSLPVKLAISLLKDRNGVIDVNLPLSGSVADPQFSVGPLVWRMVLTLIGRAIISPFSLIAGAASGGDAQASVMAFDPGTDRMLASSKERADTLVKAMNDRPTLKMTLLGQVNGKTEKAALQRDRLQQLIWEEKLRQQGKEPVAGAERGPVSAQEYPVLLKEVYKQSRVKKPRNLVGIPKDLSIPEMEALLQTQFPTGDDVLRELAFARAQKVKDLLLSKGLSADRVFLGNSRIDAEASQVQLQASVD